MENNQSICDHDLLKEIVINNCKDVIAIAQTNIELNEQENKLESILNYILSINTHQYFTLDNFRNITDHINDDLNARDFIFNLTDSSILEFIGKNGDLSRIIGDIVKMFDLNKNTGIKLYDSRIVDASKIDKDNLTKILEGNSYFIVLYFLVLYPIPIVSNIS